MKPIIVDKVNRIKDFFTFIKAKNKAIIKGILMIAAIMSSEKA